MVSAPQTTSKHRENCAAGRRTDERCLRLEDRRGFGSYTIRETANPFLLARPSLFPTAEDHPHPWRAARVARTSRSFQLESTVHGIATFYAVVIKPERRDAGPVSNASVDGVASAAAAATVGLRSRMKHWMKQHAEEQHVSPQLAFCTASNNNQLALLPLSQFNACLYTCLTSRTPLMTSNDAIRLVANQSK